MPGYSAATSLEDALPQRVALLHRVALVGHAHSGQPRARAYSNAWRTIRSTPLRVLISSWIATSSAVPALKRPPMLTYDALGVLAEHDEVHVGAAAVLERAEPIVEQRTGR